jgi:hypothetical protein
MRKAIDMQMEIDEKAIGSMRFDRCSKDEIPKLITAILILKMRTRY